MPRPAKFTESRILEAASALVAADGPGSVTMAAIAHALKAPSGSLYHRFRSRDELLGRLWLQKAAFFQDTFAAALAEPDPRRAAIEAALSLPRSARADLIGARIMLLHRRQDFTGDGWPPDMREEAARLGRQFDLLLDESTARLFGSNTQANRLRAAFALLDIPFAAVRRHVSQNRAPPKAVDHLVAVAVAAVLDEDPDATSGSRQANRRRRASVGQR
jgi:AcrR family transcriptional regulator